MNDTLSQALVEQLDDSELRLTGLELAPGGSVEIADPERDLLLYAFSGAGALELQGTVHRLATRSAGLVVAGETATVTAQDDGVALVVASVGQGADRHAPMGAREVVVSLDSSDAEKATGARSFQILFGPHNGSTRATLFAGYIPPGKAPRHYHLYDEIVWVPEGPGHLHLDGVTRELGPGTAFRLRPRQVHIVENASDREMTILGIFTPAGSPSAAYLTPDVAAEYRFAG